MFLTVIYFILYSILCDTHFPDVTSNFPILPQCHKETILSTLPHKLDFYKTCHGTSSFLKVCPETAARRFAPTVEGLLCVCQHHCVSFLVLAAGFSEESPKESCYQHIFYSSQTFKKDTLKQLESPGQMRRLSSLLPNRSPN